MSKSSTGQMLENLNDIGENESDNESALEDEGELIETVRGQYRGNNVNYYYDFEEGDYQCRAECVDAKGDDYLLGEMGVDDDNKLLVNIKHQGIGIAEKLLEILENEHGDVTNLRKIMPGQIEIEHVPYDVYYFSDSEDGECWAMYFDGDDAEGSEIGRLSFACQNYEEGELMWLDSADVAKRFQQRGIGSEMMRVAVDTIGDDLRVPKRAGPNGNRFLYYLSVEGMNLVNSCIRKGILDEKTHCNSVPPLDPMHRDYSDGDPAGAYAMPVSDDEKAASEPEYPEYSDDEPSEHFVSDDIDDGDEEDVSLSLR